MHASMTDKGDLFPSALRGLEAAENVRDFGARAHRRAESRTAPYLRRWFQMNGRRYHGYSGSGLGAIFMVTTPSRGANTVFDRSGLGELADLFLVLWKSLDQIQDMSALAPA
jgi:hypothetical protein